MALGERRSRAARAISEQMASRSALLVMYPAAPASSPAATSDSSSNADSRTTGTSERERASALMRSMPSMPGMRTSMTATSGSWRRMSASAVAPSPASATISKPPAMRRARMIPWRNSGWSSATTTRTRGGSSRSGVSGTAGEVSVVASMMSSISW